MSVGSDVQEEVLKFAWKGEDLEYGPISPNFPELYNDKEVLFEFLNRAHFIKDEPE